MNGKRIPITALRRVVLVGFLCALFAPAAPEAKPVASGLRERGDLYVLAIGINKYRMSFGGRPLTLKYAVNDARSFADEITRRGESVRAVKLLLDEEATRANIERELGDLARAMKPSDTFIFFYAGQGDHYGARTRSESGVKTRDVEIGERPGKSDFYLFPADMEDLSRPEAQAISGRLLRAYFRKIPARNQLVALDSCNTSYAYETAAASVVEQDTAAAELLDTNLLFLGADTFTYESDELRHGLITAALLEALAGKGDAGADGVVTAREIEAHLYARGLELSRQFTDGYFHPRTVTRGDDFPVARYEVAKQPGAAPAAAKRSRGAGIVGGGRPPAAARREGKDYALLIATNDYLNKQSWPYLPNPKNDVEALGRVLVEKYGFEKPDYVYDPTREELFRKIEEYNKLGFKPDDQLFVFVAGHGVAREIGTIKEGFLVAKNSPPALNADGTNDAEFMSLELFYKLLYGNGTLKHVLIAVDACYAGAVWEPTVTPFQEKIGMLPKAPLRPASFAPATLFASAGPHDSSARDAQVLRWMGPLTQLLFTSGGYEPVLDAKVERDGTNGRHSPFADALLDILRRGPTNKLGILTAGKIDADVRDRLMGEVAAAPKLGSAGGSQGTFVFVSRPAAGSESAAHVPAARVRASGD